MTKTQAEILQLFLENQTRILDRQQALEQRLDEQLDDFDELLDKALKVMGLFSQKVLEKGIQEALEEVEARARRRRQFRIEQKKRWEAKGA